MAEGGQNGHFVRLSSLGAAVMKLGVGMGAAASAAALVFGLLVSSCSSAGDLLGGLTGAVAPDDSSSALDKGDVDRLEIAAERLRCTPEAVAEMIAAERDAWKATAGDAATTSELRLQRIERLEVELEEARAQRDAAIARLDTIQTALHAPQEEA